MCKLQTIAGENDTKMQLKEFNSHEMLVTMFPNLNTLANICMTLHVSTTTVEQRFSQMKMIKNKAKESHGKKQPQSLNVNCNRIT